MGREPREKKLWDPVEGLLGRESLLWPNDTHNLGFGYIHFFSDPGSADQGKRK